MPKLIIDVDNLEPALKPLFPFRDAVPGKAAETMYRTLHAVPIPN
jgi:hypothetical protein